MYAKLYQTICNTWESYSVTEATCEMTMLFSVSILTSLDEENLNRILFMWIAGMLLWGELFSKIQQRCISNILHRMWANDLSSAKGAFWLTPSRCANCCNKRTCPTPSKAIERYRIINHIFLCHLLNTSNPLKPPMFSHYGIQPGCDLFRYDCSF